MAIRRATRLAGFVLAVVACAPILLGPGSAASAEAHYCFGRRATIVGTQGNDRLIGTDGDDVIVALGGDDFVDGKGGDDRICLGPGGRYNFDNQTEWAKGGPGDDLISGGRGSDLIIGGSGSDLILGGGGRDRLYGEQGRDRILGGKGNDYLNGGNGDDLLRGGPGDDALDGDDGDDELFGGRNGTNGDLVTYYGRYLDRNSTYKAPAKWSVTVDLRRGLATGAGRDRLDGIENIYGTEQDDVLRGSAADNLMKTGGGDDILRGRGGDDCLDSGRDSNDVDGGAGFDFLAANLLMCVESDYFGSLSPVHSAMAGMTVDLSEGYAEYHFEQELDEESHRTTLRGIEGVFGSEGDDTLLGDDSANHLFGNGGSDHIEGRGGDDILSGGGGADSVDGGDGFDVCTQAEAPINCEETDVVLGLQGVGRYRP